MLPLPSSTRMLWVWDGNENIPPHLLQHVTEVRAHLLAMTKSSGMSLASFSLTASEIGPNMTTGLLKPAENNQIRQVVKLHANKKDRSGV